MFYELQPREQQNNYKRMLNYIGQLSKLFGDSESPYLAYRIHENSFCRYFEARNLARGDVSADAMKGTVGIGLKTWMGTDDQKVAEFGRERPRYANLPTEEKVRFIANLRNERIRVTMNLYGLNTMIYHIVKRIPGAMKIVEHTFDPINIENITITEERANNIYFSDGNHTYHFSNSKNTLYMKFEDLEDLDEVPVQILDDPYEFLERAFAGEGQQGQIPRIPEEPEQPQYNLENSLCLRLYSQSRTRGKFVADRSGLNQWNAQGRVRHADELYIPYPAEDRRRNETFFPPRDTCFNLTLPDGQVISAKVCQENSKAIMSNPNKALGHWLLREVFELPERTPITYEMLEVFGVDSVVFTKNPNGNYSVDFAPIGTYEYFYGIENNTEEE